MLLAGQADGRPLRLAALAAVIVGVCGACICIFLLATRIGNFLGHTGNAVLQRLLGVLLAAMAVQFVIDGVRAVLAA